jgi:hypothetical protein
MRKTFLSMLLLSFVVLTIAAVPAHAQGGTVRATLQGFEEVPAIYTPAASGQFTARINGQGTEVTYTLTYSNLRGNATQSHIHFGQKGVNGGIVVFFCSNLGNGPAGTPACPAKSGTLTGTITASNVLGVTAQGISPGQLEAIVTALRSGVAYVNVHSDLFPGGEIRGQVNFTRRNKSGEPDEEDDSN